MVAKLVNKKNAGKPRVLAFNALLNSLAALAATFNTVAFYFLPLIMMQGHGQSEFCLNLMDHESPHLEKFTWQNLTPAERVTRSSRPGYPPWRVTPPIM